MIPSNPLETIHQITPLKAIADPRRLAILRQLMAAAATLTQLGKILDAHPAKVRYHLKQLEKAGLVQLVRTEVVGGNVEKYYQATAGAYRIDLTILPQLSPEAPDPLVILGSDDLALNHLAAALAERGVEPGLLVLPVGSLDGLIALRQGACQLSGCHLIDPASGEYNLPYVQHFFPDRTMVMVTLAYRQQGLIMAPGNPHQIESLGDLTQPEVRFLNRPRGSGTRLWLDHRLHNSGIPPEEIAGYEQAAQTHLQVARAVARGEADVGLGILAAAQQLELEFLPLFEERYDLIFPREALMDRAMHPIFETLQTAEYRQAVNRLGGYTTRHTGEQLVVRGT